MKPGNKETNEKEKRLRRKEGRRREEDKKGKEGGGEGEAGIQGQLGQWRKGRIIFQFVLVQPNLFHQLYKVTCVNLKGSLGIIRSAKWNFITTKTLREH